MPLYEYLCRDCDSQTELLVNGSMVSTKDGPACPACGSQQMTKLLSVVAAGLRDSASGRSLPQRPSGSCGSGCGCHPRN